MICGTYSVVGLLARTLLQIVDKFEGGQYWVGTVQPQMRTGRDGAVTIESAQRQLGHVSAARSQFVAVVTLT